MVDEGHEEKISSLAILACIVRMKPFGLENATATFHTVMYIIWPPAK